MTPLRWYRLAEGTLGIASSDQALARRFDEIYGACAVAGPLDGPQVVCRAEMPAEGLVRVTYDDPEPLDDARFLQAVFPDRGYRPVPTEDGAVLVRLPGTTDDVVLSHGVLTAPAGSAWQPLAANLAVSRILRLQRTLMFFHAASANVHGRGLMVCGPKRSGKTTLSLSLAARGHSVLGDEVAALHLTDQALLPFRRSLAVRQGPASDAATAMLQSVPRSEERFPDGEMRQRFSLHHIAPTLPSERTPLTAVVVLRHFSTRTAIRPLRLGHELLAALTPMAVSLWDRPPGAIMVRLIGALSAARLFEVESGPPDDVADQLIRLLEE